MSSVLPVKSQWENGPLQGRTSQVAGAMQAGGSENRPHMCQENRDLTGRTDDIMGSPLKWQRLGPDLRRGRAQYGVLDRRLQEGVDEIAG